MCDVLKEIYSNIYDEKFDYSILAHRIKMQKSVYFLENMGISVGDYSFSWNKYGPYSLQLDSEAKRCANESDQNIVFSDEATKVFNKITDILSQAIEYPVERWVECITSLHYMKNIFKIEDSSILAKLVEKKPYLNNECANKRALEIAKQISVG